MPNRKASAHRPLPPAIAQRLATTLRATRENAAMTQEATASAAGVSVQMIRRLEAGTANPTLGTLHAVAGALDTNMVVLLQSTV
ncbi:helix-turn-helix domain-containing protein [Nocardioides aurantiacus]|nr:helix-turn-helix transcriptional regulator [Nocardioides aurantiacus]